MGQPIRHHYIPRFLIRPFCFEEGQLFYFDKERNEVIKSTPEDVFMERNLYRDSINHKDNPTQIENDLAKFENRMAKIIKKMRDDDEVILTLEQEESLRLFFAIMGFRAKRTSEMFGEKHLDDFEQYYSLFQEDGDLTDFWKRNLGELVNCRSLQDVFDNPVIDDPIKLFMRRDVYGLFGLYPMIIERRGNEDFILSDCYPLIIEGSFPDGVSAPVYSVYPISPSRAVILVAVGAEGAPSAVTGFEAGFFQRPRMQRDRKSINIHIKKVYEEYVHDINQMLIDNMSEGVILQNEKAISNYIK